MDGIEGQKRSEKQGISRRDVLKGTVALAVASLSGDTLNDMSALESADQNKDKVDLPQRKFFTDAVEKAFAEKGSNLQEQAEAKKMMDSILDTYVETNLANTAVFTTTDGTKIPYTMFDSAKVAKTLYHEMTGEDPVIHSKGESEKEKIRKEFTFSTPLESMVISTFMPYEEHVRQLMMRLPKAIEALKRHEEPVHDEIYAIGQPYNRVGHMSDAFIQGVREEGVFEEFGRVFGELIASKMPADSEQKKKTVVTTYGMSLAGSTIPEALRSLANNGITVQQPPDADWREQKTEEENARRNVMKQTGLPRVMARTDFPVGQAEDASRSVLLGGLKQNQQNKEYLYGQAWMAKAEQMGKNIARALHRGGIEQDLSKEQEKFRSELLPNIMTLLFKGGGHLVAGLRAGTPVPDNVRLRRVRAQNDPYMPSEERSAEIDATVAKPHSLGQRIIASPSENIHTHGLKGSRHEHDWFRPTEMRKMTVAIESLLSLRS